ncbi:MAG TPA: DNA-processing protein DprA [Candidatus Fusicatenibacter merdavium]|uniref:DNA-processing protein DprA n=1 Tax=Candidatus Fusicatenibacter merdavium TaxID=2838600 RepID=A0A9D1XE41_9FIRM|nr:DNA-processing protein DprA [Candidatus Fusicatenibacter merdavium]
MESIVYYDQGDKEYPARMKPLPGMPKGIYVKGKLPRDDLPSAAIVGGRACSAYGREQARRFARELAAAGVQIISGLASGIDAAAHEGALEGGGLTFAVLGCGVNICYPRENYPLMRRILEQEGGVLSEFQPGERPLAWHFPQRNRVISALADLVLVVEARQKSGSLITADYALEQGKSVYALPGRVNETLSEGSNRLIAQGAGIAVDPTALLEELESVGKWRFFERPAAYQEATGSERGRPSGTSTEAGRKLSREEKRVLRAIEDGSHTLEELHHATGHTIPELSALLVRMQLDGFLFEDGKNVYFLRG